MSRTRSLPFLLLLATASCSESPVALAAHGASEAASGAASRRAGPTAGIDALITASEESWAAKDAAAYAALYTEDTEMVNPLGGIVAGRATFQAMHEMLFHGPFAGSTSDLELRNIVWLTGAHAQVDLNVTLTGFVGTPPGLPQAAPGVVRTRVRWIVERRGDDWLVRSQQMTPLPPGGQF